MLFVTWYNKELQVHPMKLLFYITLMDAMIGYNILAAYRICDWDLGKVYAETIMRDTSLKAKYEALQILYLSANIFGLFLLAATLMYNTFLGVDLILMIKYPFKVKD